MLFTLIVSSCRNMDADSWNLSLLSVSRNDKYRLLCIGCPFLDDAEGSLVSYVLHILPVLLSGCEEE